MDNKCNSKLDLRGAQILNSHWNLQQLQEHLLLKSSRIFIVSEYISAIQSSIAHSINKAQ